MVVSFMNSIKVACIQMDISHCNKEANLLQAFRMAETAVSEGADILVFPEVFSTGFCYDHIESCAESENGKAIQEMCAFSRDHECVLIFSIIEKQVVENDINYYNLGVCIEDGEVVGTYRKTHPFKKEKQYFSSGDEIEPIRLKNRQLTIGMQICYELRFPEVARKLALEGSDLLVTIAEFPTPRGHIWKSLAIARAIENQIPHVACNRVGKGPDQSFFGGSIIVDALGEVKEEADDSGSVIVQNIDLERTMEIRSMIPVFEDRRSDLY